MGQRTHLRLHMGCGEALRSRLAPAGGRRPQDEGRGEAGRGNRALAGRHAQRTQGDNKHS